MNQSKQVSLAFVRLDTNSQIFKVRVDQYIQMSETKFRRVSDNAEVTRDRIWSIKAARFFNDETDQFKSFEITVFERQIDAAKDHLRNHLEDEYKQLKQAQLRLHHIAKAFDIDVEEIDNQINLIST